MFFYISELKETIGILPEYAGTDKDSEGN